MFIFKTIHKIKNKCSGFKIIIGVGPLNSRKFIQRMRVAISCEFHAKKYLCSCAVRSDLITTSTLMAYRAGVIVMLALLCSGTGSLIASVLDETISYYKPLILVSGYPYNVNVTEIKATSARLHWKTTELVVEEFLVWVYFLNTCGAEH